MRSDLPVTELAENVYLLNEFDGTNCYLVVGSEKALLIDCGTGFCDIRGAAEKLTDLPDNPRRDARTRRPHRRRGSV